MNHEDATNDEVLGFHLRVPPLMLETWNSERRDLHLLNPAIDTPLSVDQSVWPRAVSATKYRELFSDYYGEPDDGVATNGLNLYRVRSADIFRTARELRDEALIGISCGAADAQRLRTRHGLDPSEVNVQYLRDTEWTFLGYDVADEWLLSGLSNCGLGRDQSADTKSQYNAEMNSLGLFASAHAAERFAHFLDARVTEHAPFSVYGIWRR